MSFNQYSQVIKIASNKLSKKEFSLFDNFIQNYYNLSSDEYIAAKTSAELFVIANNHF